jgi:hypothetical protein
MRRIAMAVSAVAVVLLSASLFAQAKPNFSGKWALDMEKTMAANPNAGGGGGGGMRMGGGGGGMGGGATTITMDAATLTIERETPNGAQKQVYKLDGSESKNMMMGRGGQTEQVSKATVEGNKVVIKTQGQNGEQVTSWYMDGDFLVSERTTQNGAQKTYYKKA